MIVEGRYNLAVMEDVRFCDELKSVIERSGLSLHKIARLSHCSASTLSRAINGLAHPSRSMLLTWCNVLRNLGEISQEEMDNLLELEYREAVGDTNHSISIRSQED